MSYFRRGPRAGQGLQSQREPSPGPPLPWARPALSEDAPAPPRRRGSKRRSRRKPPPGHGQSLILPGRTAGARACRGGARHSPLRPAPRPGRAPCAPSGPAAGPGRVKTLRDAVARGGPVPAALRGRARRSPSMSLVTVLKCIFCGRQPGRAGALRPPRRSSSAPFPACSAAAATEIREAILKAFALGDRGLFSSIGETPMQEQQPRQPPTTSPPSHPLTPLLSTAPSREVRARPPSFQTGGGGGGKLKKKKPKNKSHNRKQPKPSVVPPPPREGRWGARNFPGALCSQRRAPQRAGSSPVSGRGTGGTGE